MWQILVSYLILSVSVMLIAIVIPGIKLKNYGAALKVAGVYGLLNFLLFKVLLFITFPLVILKVLTLGLFGVVINAAMLMATDKVLDDFEISGFGAALMGAAGISIVNLILQAIF